MKRQWILIGTMVAALLLVVGLLAGCGGTQKAQLDAFNTAKTKAEANKAVVRSYYDIVNLPDLKGYVEFLSPNYKRYLSPTAAPLTADGNKKRLAGFHTVCPDDFKLTVEDMIAEGDRVVARCTFTGTQKGTFMGIPPTGKPVKIWNVEVFRIENGKIIEQWGGPDLLDSLQQIGAVISAGK